MAHVVDQVHVTVLAQSWPAAEVAYEEIDRGNERVVDPPVLAATGWWRIDGDVGSDRVVRLAAELIKRRVTALLLQADRAPVGVVSSIADGMIHEIMWGARSEGGASGTQELAAWSTMHAPRRVSARAWQRLLSDAASRPGVEAVDLIVERLGWRAKTPDIFALLDGCTGILSSEHPTLIGETVIDWERCRFVIGGQAQHFAMWDLDAPGRPVRTWPKTSAGRAECVATQYELVALPILNKSRLVGERSYAPCRFGGSLGVLVHFNEGFASVVLVKRKGARTWLVSHEGEIAISGQKALAGGVPVGSLPPPAIVMLPAESRSDVESIAELEFGDDLARTWRAVPDDVPRSFIATCDWVRIRLTET